MARIRWGKHSHRLQSAPRVHLEKDYLGHDGTEFPTRRCDSVRSRAVARGEDLSGDDERRNVRPKVGEEVCQAVQRKECLGVTNVIRVRLRTRIDARCQKAHQ